MDAIDSLKERASYRLGFGRAIRSSCYFIFTYLRKTLLSMQFTFLLCSCVTSLWASQSCCFLPTLRSKFSVVGSFLFYSLSTLWYFVPTPPWSKLYCTLLTSFSSFSSSSSFLRLPSNTATYTVWISLRLMVVYIDMLGHYFPSTICKSPYSLF